MTARRIDLIEWLDHCSLSGDAWRSIEDVERLQPITVMSVGTVVAEDKQSVVLAATVSEGGQAWGEICILKRCIVKRTALLA